MRDAAIRVARWIIGAVFVAAALAKIGGLEAFALQVHNFRMMPLALENLAAITVPWIELVAGLSLILGIHARSGALIATVLMTVFVVAVGAAMVRGLDIECGCFGTADATRVGVAKLLQNLALLAVAVVASARGEEA